MYITYKFRTVAILFLQFYKLFQSQCSDVVTQQNHSDFHVSSSISSPAITIETGVKKIVCMTAIFFLHFRNL